MKKFLWIVSLTTITGAYAATPWWQQPTVCRLNPTNCYTTMGSGYDSGMWDATSNCWGLKLICPEAMRTTVSEPTPMGRKEIAAGTNIKADFDVTVLNGDCFGLRKTTANGTRASVNDTFVNVYCSGILNRPGNTIENVATGEIITSGAQPTCTELAADGYVAVINNRCYGKYFSDSEYFIDCNGSELLPKRIIVLNGADYNSGTSGMPATQADANTIFDQMYQTSLSQHNKYFK